MKRCLIILSVLYLNPLAVMAQWSEFYTGQRAYFYSISAVSDSVCWTSGSGGIIVRTTNGGKSWSNAGGGILDLKDIPSLFALDSLRAFCTTSDANGTYVYRTTNGGQSWDAVFYQAGGFINGIWFNNASDGIIMGDPVNGRWSIWRTTNGGGSWDSTGMYIPREGNENGWANAMPVIDSSIVIATSLPHIYYSDDMGFTWQKKPIPVSMIYSIAFSDKNTLIAAAGDGSLIRSSDKGDTWLQLYPGKGVFSAISGKGKVWFATGSHEIYGSADSGYVWHEYYKSNSGFFRDITKSRRGSSFWAVSTDGMAVKGTDLESGRLGLKFRAFVKRIATAKPEERGSIADSFMNANPVMPIIEDSVVSHFIYRGAASSVKLAGDMENWNASIAMEQIFNTGLWHTTEIYPSDARLEYKFVLDGSNWINDPRNPNIIPTGYNNSELRMPLYKPPLEVLHYNNIPHGTVKDTMFQSTVMGNSRKIRIYTPPGYSGAKSDSFPVVLFHDGLEFISNAGAINTLDYLIDKKAIPPVIALFVPPVNRGPEYTGEQQNQFASFIAAELMPSTDTLYRTQLRPGKRINIGISAGGNIAILTAWKYPNTFGNAASMSGNILDGTIDSIRMGVEKNVRFYIDAGRYDIAEFGVTASLFKDWLDMKGYDSQLKYWNEGHNWLNWGAHIDDVLEYFIPGEAVSVENRQIKPEKAELLQNYPNPFNPVTTIEYSIEKQSHVELVIYDILGRRITELVNRTQPAGSYKVRFNAGSLPSGVYICTIRAGRFNSTRKMMFLK